MKVLIVSYMIPEAPSGVSVHYRNLATCLRQNNGEADTLSIADTPVAVRYATTIMLKVLSFCGMLGKEVGRKLYNLIRIYAALQVPLHKNRYNIINAQDLGSAYAAKLAVGDRLQKILTAVNSKVWHQHFQLNGTPFYLKELIIIMVYQIMLSKNPGIFSTFMPG